MLCEAQKKTDTFDFQIWVMGFLKRDLFWGKFRYEKKHCFEGGYLEKNVTPFLKGVIVLGHTHYKVRENLKIELWQQISNKSATNVAKMLL